MKSIKFVLLIFSLILGSVVWATEALPTEKDQLEMENKTTYIDGGAMDVDSPAEDGCKQGCFNSNYRGKDVDSFARDPLYKKEEKTASLINKGGKPAQTKPAKPANATE